MQREGEDIEHQNVPHFPQILYLGDLIDAFMETGDTVNGMIQLKN
jgi:hypothetical protein